METIFDVVLLGVVLGFAIFGVVCLIGIIFLLKKD
jgi:hypothetical protein